MRGFFSIAFVVIALFAASDGAAAPAVRAVDVEGGTYRVVDIDLSRDALELQWMDQEGRPLASINRLREWGAANGRTLLFATNAGIYDREYRPLGLTIAEGRVLRPLNTTRGRSGNFAIQPNGVFYVDRDGHAGVATTAAWQGRGIDARIATQSGPMLVVDGEVNANFGEESESRKWRSGVCVPAEGHVAFAVSESPVTFHAFARVFRDSLGCRDALYLDGTLSRLWTAADGYSGAPAVMVKPYAAMLAVFESAARPEP